MIKYVIYLLITYNKIDIIIFYESKMIELAMADN